MKSFLKYLLAAILGTFLALVALFFVITGTLKSSFKSFVTEDGRIKENSVLVIDLAQNITDRPGTGPNFTFTGDLRRGAGLPDILDAIKRAESDERIRGALIKVSYSSPRLAMLSEIRSALVSFRESGKFIIAYGDYYGQRAYYLASLSDEIYLNPAGLFELRGFAARAMFFKDALRKLGIEMQVFYAGKYKSATEPFRLDKMSPENREQLRAYIESIYGHFIETIAHDRAMTSASVDSIARNLSVRTPQQALDNHLVDGIMYYDQVLDVLRGKLGQQGSDKVQQVSVARYLDEVGSKKGPKDQVIAVLYADGEIVDGSASEGRVGGESYARELRKLREDDKVKAIVLRINSPGGSALASELIWREAVMAAESKPLIVSMGPLAASGGYFIAAPAHTIVAQPNSLTGSIGVFLIWPNLKELTESKLGVRYDTVTIGRFADMGNPFRAVNEEEASILQAEVDRTYTDFILKVAEGRGMDTSAVGVIAQGHIWSGLQAMEIGLVDTLGGLNDAIAIAATRAGLTTYSVKAYPEPEGPFEKFRRIIGAEAYLPEWLPAEWLDYVDELQVIATQRGMMARMMWDFELR